MAGRASLTRHSRHPSTKHSLASAGTVGVCPDPLENPNATRKSLCQETRTDLFAATTALADSNPDSLRYPAHHTRTIRVDSTPIALPRPPQTRAASFKRLYPK
jgi:hypothetical protein